MFSRTYYVSIAVEDLDQAVPFFRDTLGLPLAHSGEHQGLKARGALLSTQDGGIALLQPSSKESPVQKFLETNKNRIYHIGLAADDIQAAHQTLRAKGAAGPMVQGLAGRSFMVEPRKITDYNIEVVEAGLPLRDNATDVLRVEGVQIATKDVSDSMRAFKDVLGLEPHATSSEWLFPTLSVKNRVYIVGKTQLELNEVTDEKSPFQRFLTQEGRNGYFGFSIEPKDLDIYVQRLEERGVRTITSDPVPLPIVPPSGKQESAADILTLHPSATFGARVFVLRSYIPWKLL